MRKKNKFRLPFIKTHSDNGNTQTPSTHTPTDSQAPEPKWYRTIAELPLIKFIDCIVDNNLSALIISGYPNPDVLKSAWEDILQEYQDAIGSSEHKIYQKKRVEVTRAQVRLMCIEDAIEILYKIYAKGFVEILETELQYKFNFDYTNQEDYRKKLKNAFTRSRGLKISLDMMKIQFNAMVDKLQGGDKNSKKSKPYTREHFYSYLFTLSDYAKYEIRDTITVFEFCTRVNRYGKYCEDMEKLYKKK